MLYWLDEAHRAVFSTVSNLRGSVRSSASLAATPVAKRTSSKQKDERLPQPALEPGQSVDMKIRGKCSQSRRSFAISLAQHVQLIVFANGRKN